ncbi:MAG: hypothetical protein ACKVS6_06735 [Planctomycetota bacterium]
MKTQVHSDSKGRLSLGKAFANRDFIVQSDEDGSLRIEPARLISEKEAWLYQNPSARASLRRGLKQAAEGRFATNPPDLKADAKLTKELED